MKKTITLASGIIMALSITMALIGCSEDAVHPDTASREMIESVVLGPELITPMIEVKGGRMTMGQLHNTLVGSYYEQYGAAKATDNASLAKQLATVSAPYATVSAATFESFLDHFDAQGIVAGGGDVFGHYAWNHMDSFTRSYWEGLFAAVARCETHADIRAAVIAYGSTHGFPVNKPYAAALDVLLNSNDYWFMGSDKLRRDSLVIIADGCGAIIGGLAGMGLGWIAGGPVGSAVGGVIGGGVLGAGASVALNETLPGDY